MSAALVLLGACVMACLFCFLAVHGWPGVRAAESPQRVALPAERDGFAGAADDAVDALDRLIP